MQTGIGNNFPHNARTQIMTEDSNGDIRLSNEGAIITLMLWNSVGPDAAIKCLQDVVSEKGMVPVSLPAGMSGTYFKIAGIEGSIERDGATLVFRRRKA